MDCVHTRTLCTSETSGDKVSNVDISHISSKLNNIFSEIVKDALGNLWIAAFNEGVSMIDLNKPFVQNNLLPTIRKNRV